MSRYENDKGYFAWTYFGAALYTRQIELGRVGFYL